MTQDSSKKIWRIAGFAQILIAFIAWAGFDVRSDEWWICGAYLLLSGLLLSWSVFLAARRHAEAVLADHFFVLAVAYLAYYIFGALLIPIGPREQIEFSLSYYDIDATIGMRVAIINSMGMGLALIAGSIAPVRMFAYFSRSAVQVGAKIPVEKVIGVFLIAGAISYFYVVNFELTQDPRDAVVAGLWRTFSKLLLVAIFLAVAHTGKAALMLRSMAVVLVVLYAIGGMLLLNKSQVLLPLVAFFLGHAWRKGVRRTFIPGLALLIALYLAIGSPVTTARNLAGSMVDGDWNYRISLLWSGLWTPDQDSIEAINHPWSRFCYTPPQAAALDLYDAGRGGDDFPKMGWTFVPRFLFPNKPIMTDSGPDFHYKISGNMNSSTGHGVFVNGYYNAGTFGVLIVAVSVGFMLACTSAFAATAFSMRSPLWLPVALLGSYMALRIDGHFLADYVGPFVLILYAVIGTAIIKEVTGRRVSFG